MQKALNVIKVQLLIIIILSSVSKSQAQQKINGKYSKIDLTGDFYTYYLFDDNGIFYYESGGDLGMDTYGKGHYFIKNDSLILNYDLTELKENGHHRYKTYINSNDSVQIKINTFDLDRKILSGVSVIGDVEKEYGVLSNKNGVVYLKFKKEKEKKRITISDLCCGNYSFTINSKLNYEVDIFLRKKFNTSEAIKYEIKKYKIIEFTENHIKLKNDNNGTITLNKRSK